MIESFNFLKWFLAFGTMVTLVVSAVFSMKSFTGYVSFGEVIPSNNFIAAIFFFMGIVGAYHYLKKFRYQRIPGKFN